MRAERRRIGFAVASALWLVLFVGLTVGISIGATQPIDILLRSGVHAWTSATLTAIAFAISLLGSVAVLSVLFLIALTGFWLTGRRRAAAGLSAVMAGAIILDNGLKYAFHRTRPEPFFGAAPETFSFPSGHVLFSTCFYGALAAILSANAESSRSRAAIWAAAAVLVSAIAWSRVYLGVHYPTDVMGGLLIALFWVSALRAGGLLEVPHE